MLMYSNTLKRMVAAAEAGCLEDDATNLMETELELLQDMPSMNAYFDHPAKIKFVIMLPPNCSADTIARLAEGAAPALADNRLFFCYGEWVELL